MLKYSRQELLGAVAQAHLQIGGPVEEIVTLAEETGADTAGEPRSRRSRTGPNGRVSEFVVRYAHCPVLVLRGARRG
jgi:nucleotide-binding universal stress UspA family protein